MECLRTIESDGIESFPVGIGLQALDTDGAWDQCKSLPYCMYASDCPLMYATLIE
ncbi:MAG: hypothetical protein ACYC4R_03255 [Anaerolineae bacterium]